MKEFSYGIIPIIKSGNSYKFLLIKNTFGSWGFPKGHIEKGETELETAQREFFEETSINEISIFDKYHFIESYTINKSNNKGGYITKIVKYFLGEISIDNLNKININCTELSDFKICSFDDAQKILVFDTIKNILSEANKILLTNFLKNVKS